MWGSSTISLVRLLSLHRVGTIHATAIHWLLRLLTIGLRLRIRRLLWLLVASISGLLLSSVSIWLLSLSIGILAVSATVGIRSLKMNEKVMGYNKSYFQLENTFYQNNDKIEASNSQSLHTCSTSVRMIGSDFNNLPEHLLA